MFWKIVLRGSNPSGRILAVLCARTGETIDSVRLMLDSPQGMVLQSGLSRESADALSAELPNDDSVQIVIQRDEVACVPVLMGYRPGSRGRLRIALQKLSRLQSEEVIHFLARIPIALKLNADMATAESIKRILERAGGIVEIRSPRDLIGVSSRRNRTLLSSGVVELKAENDQGNISSNNPGSSSPPVFNTARDTGREPGDRVMLEASVADPQNAPPVQMEIPSVVEDGEGKKKLFPDPYIIRFTVPAAVIPGIIPGEKTDLIPPVHVHKTVLLYLFPVADDEREQVQRILCEVLDLAQEKVHEFMERAPVAFAGFSERIDALVAMSELTDRGVPVSLVPGSSYSKESVPGRSLLGWLNGHGRTS